MSVVADVQEVFACAGHAVIEKHEQEHEPAAAEPPHKKQRTRVARHHIQWFLSLPSRLHVHGWKKKDVFMNCQRWCPEIFGNVHADTVYRLKLDGPGSGGGRPKKINGTVAEKLTVLTHDMLRQGSCVSLEIMRTLFQDLCEKDGLKVKLSCEWVRAFLVSIDLSFKAAAQRSGPKVWTLPDKVVLTKRFIMKIAFLLDEWGLDWTRTYNFDETCLCLSPTGSHGWWWKPSKQAVTVTLVTSAPLSVKVMDIIPRFPGCSGQAADAVSAYTQDKIEDAPTLLKIPKSESPDIWVRLPKDQRKTQSRKEFVRSRSGRTIMGIRESSMGTRLGNSFKTGNVYLSTEQEDYSSQCMWRISKWQEKQKT